MTDTHDTLDAVIADLGKLADKAADYGVTGMRGMRDLDAIVSRLAALRPPQGWRLVPEEPTNTMGEFGGIWCSTRDEIIDNDGKVPDHAWCMAMNCYRAMLAAAPTQGDAKEVSGE